MEKPHDSLASIQPICLTSCISKLFEHIILSRLTPFSLPARPISTLNGLLSIKISFILSPLRMGLTDKHIQVYKQAGRFSLLSTSPKLSSLSGIPSFFRKLISAGLLHCFARWTQSFLSNRCACVDF